MICKKCGHQEAVDFNFCPKCGYSNKEENINQVELSFLEAIVLSFSNLLNFNGRSRRKEYWSFVLFNSIIIFILSMVHPKLAGFYNFLMIVPNIAIACRRMHDINLSGWVMLIPIYNIILCLIDGDKIDNQYGKSNKYK